MFLGILGVLLSMLGVLKVILRVLVDILGVLGGIWGVFRCNLERNYFYESTFLFKNVKITISGFFWPIWP